MQSAGHILRRAGLTAAAVESRHRAATASRVLVLDARRNASFKSPFQWIRETLSPSIREQNSEEELEAARKAAAEKGQGNIFDAVAETVKEEVEQETKADATAVVTKGKKGSDQHKYSTAHFKISHRKLNMLGRQIAGKPIDSAIMQMVFSQKRASKRIKSMLVVAKDHAQQKGLDASKLVVSEAWVAKGERQLKRIEPRGRGKHGIRIHPDTKLHVVLKEGKTSEERKAEDRRRKLKRIVSAGIVREDVPLRNPGPAWAW